MFGDTWLAIEPMPRGEGFVFQDSVVGRLGPQELHSSGSRRVCESRSPTAP